MNKRELMELEFSKKNYSILPTDEMAKKVTELEKSLSKKLELWDDEELFNKYQRINKLNLSDRRLLLVFSILDGSVAKTAAYFSVSKKTILANITRIKEILC